MCRRSLPSCAPNWTAKIVGARSVVKQLEQGPPVEAPIQVRPCGMPAVTKFTMISADACRLAQIDIDQERANTLGIRNSQVDRIAQSALAGVKVTQLRKGDHLGLLDAVSQFPWTERARRVHDARHN